MNITKKNHYNPCFWTALWNKDYYSRMMKNLPSPVQARDHIIFSLNVKSGKIHKSKIENIHYDKNFGIAKISKEKIENFVKKYYPKLFDKFIIDNDTEEYPIFLDFEVILKAIEELPAYKTLLKVGKERQIESIEEKSFLACFIVIQTIRSHAIMNSMIQFSEEIGEDKFEHFIVLKWMLGDTDWLCSIVYPLITRRWILFTATNDLFPLCDSPILVRPDSLMVALSPRVLLEIKQNIRSQKDELFLKKRVNRKKLDEFRQRTIRNTFREIIGNEKILKEWKNLPEFKKRVSMMKNLKYYNKIVSKEGNKELWHINAYANLTREKEMF